MQALRRHTTQPDCLLLDLPAHGRLTRLHLKAGTLGSWSPPRAGWQGLDRGQMCAAPGHMERRVQQELPGARAIPRTVRGGGTPCKARARLLCRPLPALTLLCHNRSCSFKSPSLDGLRYHSPKRQRSFLKHSCKALKLSAKFRHSSGEPLISASEQDGVGGEKEQRAGASQAGAFTTRWQSTGCSRSLANGLHLRLGRRPEWEF